MLFYCTIVEYICSLMCILVQVLTVSFEMPEDNLANTHFGFKRLFCQYSDPKIKLFYLCHNFCENVNLEHGTAHSEVSVLPVFIG